MGETLDYINPAAREVLLERGDRRRNRPFCQLAGRGCRYAVAPDTKPPIAARTVGRLLALCHARFVPVTTGLAVTLSLLFWWIGVAPWIFRLLGRG